MLLLKNFHITTTVTDLARLLGSLLKLRGPRDWNSLYAIIKQAHFTPRSCSFVIKIRDLSYFARLISSDYVRVNETGVISLTYRERAIRGCRLDDSSFSLRIKHVTDVDFEGFYVASMKRSYKDIKDVIIRLERHFGDSLHHVASISVSKSKFFIEFLSEEKLSEFFTNEYFSDSVKVSNTYLHLDLCQRVMKR